MDDYVKTVWADESEPAIDAENLNKIEDGIYDSRKGIKDLSKIMALGGLPYI